VAAPTKHLSVASPQTPHAPTAHQSAPSLLLTQAALFYFRPPLYHH
jgi:hypothetical protein